MSLKEIIEKAMIRSLVPQGSFNANLKKAIELIEEMYK